MPIAKSYTAPNFAATTFHAVKRATVDFGPGVVRVDVQSFPSDAAHAAGARPVWSTPVAIPAEDLTAVTAPAIEAWLIANPGPFLEGTIV